MHQLRNVYSSEVTNNMTHLMFTLKFYLKKQVKLYHHVAWCDLWMLKDHILFIQTVVRHATTLYWHSFPGWTAAVSVRCVRLRYFQHPESDGAWLVTEDKSRTWTTHTLPTKWRPVISSSQCVFGIMQLALRDFAITQHISMEAQHINLDQA